MTPLIFQLLVLLLAWVRVAPFGHQKSEELTSDTVGCACVAILMAMPEEFRLKVGALDP